MPEKSSVLRDWVAVILLGGGFLFMMWPLIMWMRILGEPAGRSSSSINGVAAYALWFWPFSGGLIVMSTFYVLRFSANGVQSMIPLIVGIIQLGFYVSVSIICSILSAISGIDGVLFIPISLAIAYLMYRIHLRFVRKSRDGTILWNDTLLEKAQVFSFFGIPFVLSFLIRFTSIEWYGVL